MIKVIYIIFTVIIRDLEIRFSNINLFLRENVICFEPLTQKVEINKQIANILYYKY